MRPTATVQQCPCRRWIVNGGDVSCWHGTADFGAAAISSGFGGSTDIRRAWRREPFVTSFGVVCSGQWW